jgi:hypothetical protein
MVKNENSESVFNGCWDTDMKKNTTKISKEYITTYTHQKTKI